MRFCNNSLDPFVHYESQINESIHSKISKHISPEKFENLKQNPLEESLSITIDNEQQLESNLFKRHLNSVSNIDLSNKSVAEMLDFLFRFKCTDDKFLAVLYDTTDNVNSSPMKVQNLMLFLNEARVSIPSFSKTFFLVIFRLLNISLSEQEEYGQHLEVLDFYVKSALSFLSDFENSRPVTEYLDLANEYLKFLSNYSQINPEFPNSEVQQLMGQISSKYQSTLLLGESIQLEYEVDLIRFPKRMHSFGFGEDSEAVLGSFSALIDYFTRHPPLIKTMFKFFKAYRMSPVKSKDSIQFYNFVSYQVLNHGHHFQIDHLILMLINYDMTHLLKILHGYHFGKYSQMVYQTTMPMYLSRQYNQRKFEDFLNLMIKILKVITRDPFNLKTDLFLKKKIDEYLLLNPLQLKMFAPQMNTQILTLKNYLLKVIIFRKNTLSILIQHYLELQHWQAIELSPENVDILSDYLTTIIDNFSPKFEYLQNSEFYHINLNDSTNGVQQNITNKYILAETLFCFTIFQDRLTANNDEFLVKFNKIFSLKTIEVMEKVADLVNLDFKDILNKIVKVNIESILGCDMFDEEHYSLVSSFVELVQTHREILLGESTQNTRFADFRSNILQILDGYFQQILQVKPFGVFLERSFFLRSLIDHLDIKKKMQSHFEGMAINFFANPDNFNSKQNTRIEVKNGENYLIKEFPTFKKKSPHLNHVAWGLHYFEYSPTEEELGQLVDFMTHSVKMLRGPIFEQTIHVFDHFDFRDPQLILNSSLMLNSINHFFHAKFKTMLHSSIKIYPKESRLKILNFFLKNLGNIPEKDQKKLNIEGLLNLIIPIVEELPKENIIALIRLLDNTYNIKYFPFYLKFLKLVDMKDWDARDFLELDKFSLTKSSLKRCVDYLRMIIKSEKSPEDVRTIINFVCKSQVVDQKVFKFLYSRKELAASDVEKLIRLTPVCPDLKLDYLVFGFEHVGRLPFELQMHYFMHFFTFYFDSENEHLPKSGMFESAKELLFEIIEKNQFFMKTIDLPGNLSIELLEQPCEFELNFDLEKKFIGPHRLQVYQINKNLLIDHEELDLAIWESVLDENHLKMPRDFNFFLFKYFVLHQFGEELIQKRLVSSQSLKTTQRIAENLLVSHRKKVLETAHSLYRFDQNLTNLEKSESVKLGENLVHMKFDDTFYHCYNRFEYMVFHAEDLDKKKVKKRQVSEETEGFVEKWEKREIEARNRHEREEDEAILSDEDLGLSTSFIFDSLDWEYNDPFIRAAFQIFEKDIESVEFKQLKYTKGYLFNPKKM